MLQNKLCISCNKVLDENSFEETDFDETGHFEVWVCSDCNTHYKVYENDKSVWVQEHTGAYKNTYRPVTLVEG